MINKKLGELLIEHCFIDRQQLDNALLKQQQSGKKLGEVLLEQKVIREEDLLAFLSQQLQLKIVEFNKVSPQHEVVQLLSEEFARIHQVLLLSKYVDGATLAMIDPLDLDVIEQVKQQLSVDVIDIVLITHDDMREGLNSYYAKAPNEKHALNIQRFAQELEKNHQEIEALVSDLGLVDLSIVWWMGVAVNLQIAGKTKSARDVYQKILNHWTLPDYLQQYVEQCRDDNS